MMFDSRLTSSLRRLPLWVAFLVCIRADEKSYLDTAVKRERKDVTNVGEKMDNKTLVIGTLESEPYVRVVNRDDGNQEFVGFIPDLMFALSRQLHFSYRFQLISPPAFGYFDNRTKEWNGLVGQVIKNSIDMAAAPISITPARQEVVDFVRPFLNLGLTVVMQRPQISSTAAITGQELLTVFQPIDANVWGSTIALILVVWAVLWLMNIYNPYEYGCRFHLGLADKSQSELFNLSGSLWFVFTSLQWQGFERAPRSVASKFLGCIWFSFVTIFLTTYMAGMVSNLIWYSLVHTDSSAAVQRPPILNLAHLMSTKQDYRVGTMANSQTYRYIMEAANGNEFAALRQNWLSENGRSLLVPNVTAGLEKVRTERFALLVESMLAKYVTNKRPCDLVTVGDEFGRRSYGFALPKGSKIRKDFDAAVLRLTEDGTIEDLERRWYVDSSECWNVTQSERQSNRSRLYAKKPKRIDANTFWGPLVVVIVGVLLTCVIACVEMTYYKYKGKVRRRPISTTTTTATDRDVIQLLLYRRS